MASSPIRDKQEITTRLPRTPFGSGQNLHTEYNGPREATTVPEIRLQPVVIPPNVVEIDQVC